MSGKDVLRWSKWVKVGLNPGKVVLRWSKWVKQVLILVNSC